MSFARRLAAIGAGLAAAALTVSAAPDAGAAPPYVVTTDPVKAAAGWLSTQFVDARYLPTPAGDRFVSGVYGGVTYLNYGENADVIFGLAAAGAAGAKIGAALGYLRANVVAYTGVNDPANVGDGAIGKTALAAIVAGADPTAFGSWNLLAQLKDDECTAVNGTSCVAVGGSRNTYTSNSESFVVLAEARAGGAYSPSAAKVAYFLSLQCADGGFTGDLLVCGSGTPDLDATAYAAMALEALGGHRAALARATAWLTAQQRAAGYWTVGGTANTNSTGLAAAALQGAGVDVSAARQWLLRQQVPAGRAGAGAFAFDGGVLPSTVALTSPSVIATAQALTGLVDRGSLATVSAAGASAGSPVFAPAAAVSTATPRTGTRLTATGTGFVAGEQVWVGLPTAAVAVATVTADPLGTARATFTVPGSWHGPRTLVLTGATSGLVARRTVTVTAASSPTSASDRRPRPPRSRRPRPRRRRSHRPAARRVSPSWRPPAATGPGSEPSVGSERPRSSSAPGCCWSAAAGRNDARPSSRPRRRGPARRLRARGPRRGHRRSVRCHAGGCEADLRRHRGRRPRHELRQVAQRDHRRRGAERRRLGALPPRRHHRPDRRRTQPAARRRDALLVLLARHRIRLGVQLRRRRRFDTGRRRGRGMVLRQRLVHRVATGAGTEGALREALRQPGPVAARRSRTAGAPELHGSWRAGRAPVERRRRSRPTASGRLDRARSRYPERQVRRASDPCVCPAQRVGASFVP